MMRLLVSTSIVVFACVAAYAMPDTRQGAPAPTGTPNIEESLAFRPQPVVTLGEHFVGSVFNSATVLPATPAAIPDDPTLFTPVLTGSQGSPAAPVSWAGENDYGLAGRFIATTHRYSGPRDELRPSNSGIRAALNGIGTDRLASGWSQLQPHVEKHLTDYAFDFGAQDLTGAVADNQRFLAMFGWQGEIDAPLMAQGE